MEKGAPITLFSMEKGAPITLFSMEKGAPITLFSMEIEGILDSIRGLTS
jgi:hypothetical protein